MLRVKLRRLDGWNEARRARAATYREALAGCQVLAEDPAGECVYHLFPVRVQERERVREIMAERGIGTGVHYWPAVHRQGPFLGSEGSSREHGNATRWSEEELSLPMFAELTEAEALAAADALLEAIEETSP